MNFSHILQKEVFDFGQRRNATKAAVACHRINETATNPYLQQKYRNSQN